VPRTEDHQETTLVLIAIFKLLKAILLIVVGIGALRLLHKDIAEVAVHWTDVLRVDPENRYVNRLLAKVLSLNDRRLAEIGLGTFLYAAVFLTEGTGLLLRKRWAEYFTAIVTGSFLPLEVWELAKRVTIAKSFVTLVNAAIVWYLIARIKRTRKESGGRNRMRVR
jgi:uncharacterized membrane protein (DUF2068 family)